MKLRVYVETSVVSYLTARPSLDALHMARQKIRDALIQLGFAAPIIATPEDLMESH